MAPFTFIMTPVSQTNPPHWGSTIVQAAPVYLLPERAAGRQLTQYLYISGVSTMAAAHLHGHAHLRTNVDDSI